MKDEPGLEMKKVESQNKSLGRQSLSRHLGTTIRQLRLQHNLTIAEVSERAGISRGMLSKIENSLDLGDITNSRCTGKLVPIWIRLWGGLGTADFNFKIGR